VQGKAAAAPPVPVLPKRPWQLVVPGACWPPPELTRPEAAPPADGAQDAKAEDGASLGEAATTLNPEPEAAKPTLRDQVRGPCHAVASWHLLQICMRKWTCECKCGVVSQKASKPSGPSKLTGLCQPEGYQH